MVRGDKRPWGENTTLFVESGAGGGGHKCRRDWEKVLYLRVNNNSAVGISDNKLVDEHQKQKYECVEEADIQ